MRACCVVVAAILVAAVAPPSSALTRPRASDLFVSELKWTDGSDFKLNQENKVAFRDIVLEGTFRRMFDRFMEKVRQSGRFRGRMFQEPIRFDRGMRFAQKSDLYNVQVEANNMAVWGTHGLNMTYIRVIRHFGLRDVKLNLRLETDLRITGNYKVKGSAVGFLPLDSNDEFVIDVKGFSLSAITFLAKDKEVPRLVARDLKVQVDFRKLHFDFKNIMGGGVMGSAANMVINTLGEAVVENHKKNVISALRSKFRQYVSMVL